MNKYCTPLFPNGIYHVYNRAIGDEQMFRCAENYLYFLRRFHHHTGKICETFGYTLIPNHFHFVIKTRSQEECVRFFEQVKSTSFDPGKHDLSDFIMERFSNFCNGYAKAYNKMYDRKGSLFIDYMKRKEVLDQQYLKNLINYIHYNPVSHGLCKNPLTWQWTSLHDYLANNSSLIAINEVRNRVGSFDDFRSWHERMVEALPEYEFLDG